MVGKVLILTLLTSFFSTPVFAHGGPKGVDLTFFGSSFILLIIIAIITLNHTLESIKRLVTSVFAFIISAILYIAVLAIILYINDLSPSYNAFLEAVLSIFILVLSWFCLKLFVKMEKSIYEHFTKNKDGL